MANIKLDLLNELRNDKNYEELELVRLAQDPNLNYRIKIECMKGVLKTISNINASIGLVDIYSREAPVNTQQSSVQQGQSHSE